LLLDAEPRSCRSFQRPLPRSHATPTLLDTIPNLLKGKLVTSPQELGDRVIQQIFQRRFRVADELRRHDSSFRGAATRLQSPTIDDPCSIQRRIFEIHSAPRR
jgi:hypothetical protein